MSGQKLRNVLIAGYKSIHNQNVPISDLNILIGQNGAGKSNFVSAFRFVRHIIEGRLQQYVKRMGAENLLYYGSKITRQLAIELEFERNTYSVTLMPDQEDNLFISEEQVGVWNRAKYDAPYLNTIGANESESVLPKMAQRQWIPDFVLKAMQGCRVYHFHDTSETAKVKKFGSVADDIYLQEDASNLAAFLYGMKETVPKHYAYIEKTIQLVIPFFKSFVLRPSSHNEDNIRLRWRDNYSDRIFAASELSDGSLRFICLAVLLLQPDLPQVILLDEPELGLHPAALTVLASLLRKAAGRSQVIVSTQSVNLVNEFDPEDIIVVDREEGASLFHRLETEKLKSWLEQYSLGDLWDKNVIGGRP